MNTFEAIENRRSIRKFTKKEIPSEVITKIIEAGLKAPSAKNKQPWTFIIAKGDEKDKIISVIEQGVEREKTVRDCYRNENILSLLYLIQLTQ